ncbi:amylo-alpha-1,6-glucosidase [Acidimicrobium ferrooxidans DSM 10331]|uniref:Amylo-alpha-1,6-glucosidase n=1 Tax=Acidimicrobium ferrooxidans (strain DSM 10331 / JCM 15462 / NBRC 103882 / ICP) TaxID=525909 RepID=C7M2T4_ACIFD|nr:glycogen debranching N-terminal domain-containing protein [Acidimicrobium ferrooxidans]ACU53328.1 amylo-alpha-1,6-glucosidase [Acidimicrobium ferrooxidans DSM 10331]
MRELLPTVDWLGSETITLADDDEILVTARNGSIDRERERGYFVKDTRLLSGWSLTLGTAPLILVEGAALGPRAARLEFTNPTLTLVNHRLDEGDLRIRLDRVIGPGIHDDLLIENFSLSPISVDLELGIESDFADIFDVRSGRRARRGSVQTTWDPGTRRLETTYRNGAFARALVVEVAEAPAQPEYANGRLIVRIALEPRAETSICLRLHARLTTLRSPTYACEQLVAPLEKLHQDRRLLTTVTTSNTRLERIMRRSVDDLLALRMSAEGAGLGAHPDILPWIPAAGVPWFVALFGRDSIWTGLETVMLGTQFLQAALFALASVQATTDDPTRDAEPGKIPHELRQGELAELQLIPHTPYYGTHDATSLFVIAAGELWRWTGDRALLARLGPSVEAAIAWIDRYGDRDGDGLQEYAPRSATGYRHQGWRDAEDGILQGDGSVVDGPIALVELQGYVVAAKRAWANVLEEAFGDLERAATLREEASRLVEAIEERFWWPEESTYYLGLDGAKRPIDSVASNPSHLLWAQVPSPERARAVADRLLAPDLFSGWGLRTLSSNHPAYNPLSYQRGSVWPHDNAIAIAGLAAYGLADHAHALATALLDAGTLFAGGRLPELFTGVDRDAGAYPRPYRLANAPQAWAAGAFALIVAALLGLAPNAAAGTLTVRPALPAWLDRITLTNLQIGDHTTTVTVERRRGETTIEATGSSGLVVEFASEPHAPPRTTRAAPAGPS